MTVASENPLQVVELASLGSSPRIQSKRLGCESGFGNEGRNRGSHQHQNAPGGKANQQDRVGSERDCVLRDSEDLQHQRQGSRRRFAASVLHLVVDIGVLEVAKLERKRLLEDLDIDDISEGGPQQLAKKGQAPIDAAGSAADTSVSAAIESALRQSARQTSRNVPGTCRNTPLALLRRARRGSMFIVSR